MKAKIRTAVIAAGGYGTRFLPFTKAIPKELLPLGDTPAVELLVSECFEAGIDEVYIIVRSESDIVQKHFGGNTEYEEYLKRTGKENFLSKFHASDRISHKIFFVEEDPSIPYGNARGLYSIRDKLAKEDAFLLLFGDDIVISDKSSIKGIVDFYRENSCSAVVGAQRVDITEVPKYGNIKLKDGAGNVIDRIIQKPRPDQVFSDLVIYSQLILTPEIFDFLNPEATSAELDVGVALNEMAKTRKVQAYICDGRWVTIGDPVNFLKANLAYMIHSGMIDKNTLKEFLNSL